MASFISAIILAAGMSKRMGKPKQLLKFGDQTLLEKTLDTVKKSRVCETILVLGHQAELIRQTIPATRDVKVIINESYEKGMSTSIQTGLQEVSPQSEGALIVLADQPFLKPDVIDNLIAEREASKASILLPVYQGFRGNPVLIDRSLFPEMMQISGDIGCRSLFGLHPEKIRKVPVDDVGILIDIDKAEDLEKVNLHQERAFHKSEEQDRLVEETSSPRRRLIVIGQSDVAQSIVRFGTILKFHITVVAPLIAKEDANGADETLDELELRKLKVTPATSIVVASRGKFDEEALEQALLTPAGYIGLLGSKKRGAEVMNRMRYAGFTEETLGRVKFPAGLEIHAVTPEEIALSVIAEIISRNEATRAE
jgi:molybdenum cofactor cytidylyltransferase